jgi:hypothetical protein
MRSLAFSAAVAGIAGAFCLAAAAGAVAGSLDSACQAPARLGCGACAVSCAPGTIPVCRTGMSVWRGAAWACAFQPICACQRSLWEVWR